jgi:hypothetical protein
MIRHTRYNVVLECALPIFSIFAGGTQADADGPARELAVDAGNNIIEVSAASVEADWLPVVSPIYASWIADVAESGIDGQALIDRAQELMGGQCAQ